MSKDEIEFIKSLTKQQAIEKWEEATEEMATEICYSWKQTKGLQALNSARLLIQDFVRQGGKVGLPQLQFYFYAPSQDA